jgi:hypothetical protein
MKSCTKVFSILVAGFFLLETALAPLALATKPAGQQDIGNYINTKKIAPINQIPVEQTFKELAVPGAKLKNEFGPDSAVSERRKAKIINGLSNMPVNFIENKGQVNERVKYYAKQRGATIYFTADEIVFDFVREKKNAAGNSELEKSRKNSNAYSGKETRSKKEYERQVVRMKINGSNALAQITGINKLQGTHNYFIGNDKSKWRTDVPAYGEVFYKDVYAGIDLKFYANNGTLEYDFIVQPGGNPEKIDVAFEGIDGMKVAQNGDLLIRTAFGEIRQKAPHIYQRVKGEKVEIAGGFKIKQTVAANLDSGNNFSYGFKLDNYNKQYALVIDPALVYSTFMGGTKDDSGRGIAVDGAGNAYVTGYTLSNDFPVTAIDTTYNGNNDVFVFKINSAGNALDYSTYLGGSGDDYAYGIAVDNSGNAYVTGKTASINFPTRNALYPDILGSPDAFVTKINSSGNALVYSTYLGGSKTDAGYAIAVDDSGNAYVAGETNSDEFPVKNAFQNALAGYSDAFVTKINSTGSSIVYSTYFGGAKGSDSGRGVAVDSAGNMYVTGYTTSSDLPVENALQSSYRGSTDAFVTKINSSGNALVYSTYLGGSKFDAGYAIAVDSSGNVYITGNTNSGDFPTEGVLYHDVLGSQDVFVTKINASGSAFVYSTYIGGGSGTTSYAYGIAADIYGNAYVTGYTNGANFPTANALSPDISVAHDAFVTKINATGDALIYSTYLGDTSNHDYGFAIAADSFGNAYVTGDTSSRYFPLKNAIQPELAGGADVFVTKLGPIGKCVSKPVKISQTSVEYDTIQAAYSAATNTNHTILIQIEEFSGPLNFAANKQVSLLGGYYCDFVTSEGFSLITDSVTIGGSATVVMGNIIIK